MFKNIFAFVAVLGLASVTAAGVLPTSRGGTGANLTPSAGKIIYSTSSGLALSTVAGTSGQVLISNGSTVQFKSSVLLPSGGTLVLPAGGATLGTAPFTITAGSTLTTPQKGAIESDGTRLYWTNSSGARFYFNFTAQ